MEQEANTQATKKCVSCAKEFADSNVGSDGPESGFERAMKGVWGWATKDPWQDHIDNHTVIFSGKYHSAAARQRAMETHLGLPHKGGNSVRKEGFISKCKWDVAVAIATAYRAGGMKGVKKLFTIYYQPTINAVRCGWNLTKSGGRVLWIGLFRKSP